MAGRAGEGSAGSSTAPPASIAYSTSATVIRAACTWSINGRLMRLAPGGMIHRNVCSSGCGEGGCLAWSYMTCTV
jgi:hypothetical protein